MGRGNKHDRECLANWAKENRVKDWERIYEGNHPTEVNKRRQQALKYSTLKYSTRINREKENKRYKYK